jgi:hypothetical protein
MCGHDMTVGQLHFEGGIGKCFHNRAFKFNNVILRQNNPSYSLSSPNEQWLL